MKVAILGEYFFNTTKFDSGTGSVINNLLCGLRTIENLEIHLIASTTKVKKDTSYIKDSVYYHFLPAFKHFGNISSHVVDRCRIRKKTTEINPDIVHSHSQGKYTYAALQTKYPTVITVHGFFFKIPRKGIAGSLRNTAMVNMEKQCLKKAKTVIVNNAYMENSIESMTKAKIYIIENPINNLFFDAKRDREERNSLLFAGRITAMKGVLELLSALKIVKEYIPDVQLYIAGKIENNRYYSTLLKYINKHELSSNIHFLGFLTEEALLENYEKCSLFVLPSMEESASIVTAQAMATGKAVVASRVGGIPYLVQDGETGLLSEVGNIAELANNIRRLLENNSLRTAMGLRGQDQAATRFKPSFIAEKTYAIYKKAL